ncbi:MAG TPA: enoyl-CoA hydratase/isomerase family protein, partial [Variovorax sp.]|nr:enoyl-CoA hydratase/isomerase family protein [Variovorax sp.]
MAEAPALHHHHELREEMRGPVMWLTIDREERRNAISPGVLAALSSAL